MRSFPLRYVFGYSGKEIVNLFISLFLFFLLSFIITFIFITSIFTLNKYILFSLIIFFLFVCLAINLYKKPLSFKDYVLLVFNSVVWGICIILCYLFCGFLILLPFIFFFLILRGNTNWFYQLSYFTEVINRINFWFASIFTFFLSFGVTLLNIFIIIPATLFQNQIPNSDVPQYSKVIPFGIFSLLIATTIPYFILIREVIKQYKLARNLKGLSSLEPKYKEKIDIQINNLIAQMKPTQQSKLVTRRSKVYLIDKKDYGIIPSMIVSSSKLHIIFPLGYFKALRNTPKTADALLAHELAHFIHNDCNLLLAIRCYFKSAAIFPAIVVLNFFVNFIITIYQSRFVSPIEPGSPMVALSIFMPLLAIPFHFLLLRSLRRRVQRSEELADFFAVLITSASALKEFLNKYIKDFDDPETLHPPVKDRIKHCTAIESLKS